MEIRQIKTFFKIIQLGSFSKAGDELGYSQSAVTAHIKALEDELGVKLFDRSKKRVSATIYGQMLQRYALQLLDNVKMIENLTDDYLSSTESIRIAVPGVVAWITQPKILSTFRKMAPNVQISSYNYHSGDLIRKMILEGALDFALVLDDKTKKPNLTVERIKLADVCLIGANELDESKLNFTEIGNSLGAEFLSTEGDDCSKTFLNYLKESEIKPTNIMVVAGVQLTKNLIIENIGITVLPRIAVENDLENGLYKEIKTPFELPKLPINMIYIKSKWETSAVHLLKNLYRKMF